MAQLADDVFNKSGFPYYEQNNNMKKWAAESMGKAEGLTNPFRLSKKVENFYRWCSFVQKGPAEFLETMQSTNVALIFRQSHSIHGMFSNLTTDPEWAEADGKR
jgi:hypothetical protein